MKASPEREGLEEGDVMPGAVKGKATAPMNEVGDVNEVATPIGRNGDRWPRTPAFTLEDCRTLAREAYPHRVITFEADPSDDVDALAIYRGVRFPEEGPREFLGMASVKEFARTMTRESEESWPR